MSEREHSSRRLGPILIQRYLDSHYGDSLHLRFGAGRRLELGRIAERTSKQALQANWIASWSWRGDRRHANLRPRIAMSPGRLSVDFRYRNLSAGERERERELQFGLGGTPTGTSRRFQSRVELRRGDLEVGQVAVAAKESHAQAMARLLEELGEGPGSTLTALWCDREGPFTVYELGRDCPGCGQAGGYGRWIHPDPAQLPEHCSQCGWSAQEEAEAALERERQHTLRRERDAWKALEDRLGPKELELVDHAVALAFGNEEAITRELGAA